MARTSPQPSPVTQRERKRDVAARLLRAGLSKGEIRIKHAVGLGATPNVVPEGRARLKDKPREVFIAWHPVGGFAGEWFEKTGVGQLITEKINSYPDPTQHWAVVVGDYAHQLWMDENFHVIYTNAVANGEDWKKSILVGKTRFNDEAIRLTSEAVIQQMRNKQPAYNLITNNCQTYALLLLDAIKADGRNQFPTTANVYQAVIGRGKVLDLFQPATEGESNDTVSAANSAMQQNTPQISVPDGAAQADAQQSNKGGLFRRLLGNDK